MNQIIKLAQKVLKEYNELNHKYNSKSVDVFDIGLFNLAMEELRLAINDSCSLEGTIRHFLIISKSCNECGCEIAVKLLQKEPTQEEIDENENSIGGMSCILTKIVELDEDGYSQAKMFD